MDYYIVNKSVKENIENDLEVIQTKCASDHNGLILRMMDKNLSRTLKKLTQFAKYNAKIKSISRRVLKILSRE